MSVLLSSLALLAALPPAPAERGSSVVVMLKDGCPCARECRVALNALARACRGRVRFVGVLDGDEAKARALARSAGLEFPVVPDPRLALVRRWRGHEALDLRLVGPDGTLVRSWDGLDRANVAALVDGVRASTGRDVALDLTPFTVTPKLGCVFML